LNKHPGQVQGRRPNDSFVPDGIAGPPFGVALSVYAAYAARLPLI
jgi:hypothetical protein